MSRQRIAGSIATIVEAACRPSAKALALGAIVAAVAAWAATAASSVAAGGCASFPSQAAAQEQFVHLGGSPARDAAALDADGDGVACEILSGPYEGFATIAYNVKRGFFYGTASMPPKQGGSGFACLSGNRHFPEGPRLLRIFKVEHGADRVISRAIRAEAKPAGGHLVWKLEEDLSRPGSYYAAFEEEVRLSPYKPTECPGFTSRDTRLPRFIPSAPLVRGGR